MDGHDLVPVADRSGVDRAPEQIAAYLNRHNRLFPNVTDLPLQQTWGPLFKQAKQVGDKTASPAPDAKVARVTANN